MTNLTIIKQNGTAYIDSREVADMIGKSHRNLLRDIRGYVDILVKRGLLNFEPSNFFIKSSYINTQNKEQPCYLLSKMGCELVANKLTGEKGILFTAAYVGKFNELERLEAACMMRPPLLGEINAAARIIVRGMKNLGASPERIMDFLKDTYERFGFTVDDTIFDEDEPHWYTTGEIAEICGIYSRNFKPHSQAVACILNENILIGSKHKKSEPEAYGDYLGVAVRYDEYALDAVENWLSEYDYPEEIYGFDRTYHVEYWLE